VNIRQKVLLFALLLALVPIILGGIGISYFSITQSQESLEAAAANQLATSRDARKSEIETYFTTLRDQLVTMSDNLMVKEAMAEFTQAFNADDIQEAASASGGDNSALQNYYEQEYNARYKELNQGTVADTSTLLSNLSATSTYMQSQYIAFNENPLGSKDALDEAGNGTRYDQLHQKYHQIFREYSDTFSLYDVFLVDANSGNIVYSVFKELDYATSLKTGSYASTGIGRAFSKANSGMTRGEVAFDDYAAYQPSYDAEAVFISTPIFSEGRKIGVLIFQAPIDRINSIMTAGGEWESKGYGKSGESYLVGKDNLLRNESRFFKEDTENYFTALRAVNVSVETIALMQSRDTSIGLQQVDTPGTRAALNGNSGFEIFNDYRDVPVLSSYSPVKVFDTTWALMSEIDTEEAFEDATSLTKFLIFAALGIVALVGIISFIASLRFVMSFTTPILELGSTVAKINDGDTDARVNVTTQDEFGDLGDALNRLMDEKIATLVESEKENEELNNSIIGLLTAAADMSDRDFTVRVPVAADVTGSVSDALNLMSTQVATVLKDVSAIAAEVQTSALDVQEKGVSVSGLAADERAQVEKTMLALNRASETMESISTLANNCNVIAVRAAESTQKAVTQVTDTATGITGIRDTITETEKRIKRLGERSQEISSVVDIINNVAERTQVLALNASMQAAAAGEAGRGFSVVADEVQRLAKSSRESTSEITTLVGNIQSETSETMAAMNSAISQVVEGTKMAESSGKQMLETQRTTDELLAVVKQVAEGSELQAKSSSQLRQDAGEIVKSTEATAKQLEEQAQVSQYLVEQSEKLNKSVGVFKLPA
jgi:methyl-accepting chemotaxis protein